MPRRKATSVVAAPASTAPAGKTRTPARKGTPTAKAARPGNAARRTVLPLLRREQIPGVEEQYWIGRLPCGLQVVVSRRPGFASAHARVVVAAGGNHHECVLADGSRVKFPAGVAHYLEHEQFKKHGRDLTADFADMGIDVNAYTTSSETVYHIDTVRDIRRGLPLLLSLVFEEWFDDDFIEREREIILHELAGYRDMPAIEHYQATMRALYGRHPQRIDIGGTDASVRTITREMLSTFHSLLYHPANCMLIVAGDVDAREIADIAQAAVAGAGRHFPERHSAPTLPDFREGPQPVKRSVELVRHVPAARVLVAYKLPALPRSLDSYRESQELALAMSLLFGSHTDFYHQRYQRHEISGDFSASLELEDSYAFALIGGDTPHPEKLAKDIADHITSSLAEGFPAELVRRQLRRVSGSRLAFFDSPEGAAMFYQSALCAGVAPEQALSALDQATAESVTETARRWLLPERMAVSILRQPRRTGA